jgi:hypothetical protein
MANTSNKKPSRRDVAYYKQRQRNRVFSEMVRFFAEEAEQGRITKKELAEAIGKDPAQISRWFAAPSNFELDTLSELLLPMGAEMDHRIVRFSERSKPNYAHPLVAKNVVQSTTELPTGKPDLSHPVRIKPQTSSRQNVSVEVNVRTD